MGVFPQHGCENQFYVTKLYQCHSMYTYFLLELAAEKSSHRY